MKDSRVVSVFSKFKNGAVKVTDFDKERTGTGTMEWAEVTENISRGCPNNCLYCYAAHSANRFKLRERKEWANEELTERAETKSYPAKKGVIMFPSSHDITPFNIDAYIRVARLMLSKGNKLLIVSKPRIDCITKLIVELLEYRSQILFRFTIGTTNNEISRFWEPGAPLPSERINSLILAQRHGYSTSVSIEPMLSGRFGALGVFDAVRPYVTETVWIGKMNKAMLRVGREHKEAVENVLEMQRDSEILALCDDLKACGNVRWKDSINDVIARQRA